MSDLGETGNSLSFGSVDPHKQSWGQLSKNPFHFNSEDISKTPFTMNLDKLELMGFCHIKEDLQEKEILEISNDVVLVKLLMGTGEFKDGFAIYLYGEDFGKLFCHPRKLTKSRVNSSCSLKVSNHILYTEDWHSSLTKVIDDLGYRLNNVTGLDIAVDGLNHVPDFLNAYSKQSPVNKKINMIGRGTFSAKILDKKRMYYKNFQIGSNKSDKQISVYLKTSEIEKSNKQYIRDFWYKNGLRPNDKEEVFRVELRMRSKYLKEIKGFNIDACTSLKYLFMLFKTGCHNFFEFTFMNGDKKVTRQKKVKFLPQHFIDCELLEKFERPVSDGTYKAKMTVHHVVKECLTGKLRNYDASNAIGHMKKTIKDYRLESWYLLRLDDWFRLYNKLNPECSSYPELESLKLEKEHVFHL